MWGKLGMGTALPILAGPSEGRGDTAPDPGLTLTPGLGDPAASPAADESLGPWRLWLSTPIRLEARPGSGTSWPTDLRRVAGPGPPPWAGLWCTQGQTQNK